MDKRCTIIGKSGIIADGIKAWTLDPVETDRLIKTEIDLHFAPIVWKNDVNSRNEQFANLLREYELIGMPQPQVMKLLGAPDFGNCYRNYLGMCGSVGGFIELEYESDRVLGWRRASQLYAISHPFSRDSYSNSVYALKPPPDQKIHHSLNICSGPLSKLVGSNLKIFGLGQTH